MELMELYVLKFGEGYYQFEEEFGFIHYTKDIHRALRDSKEVMEGLNKWLYGGRATLVLYDTSVLPPKLAE